MRRYYISPVVTLQGDLGTVITSKLERDHPGLSLVQKIKMNAEGTAAELPWCLVLVNHADHRAILNDPEIDALPDFPLDARVTAMDLNTLRDMQAKITKAGAGIALVSQTNGYRNTIRGIGQMLDPSFNENAFDVSD